MTEMLKGGARTMPGYEDQLADGTLQKRVADPRRSSGPFSTWRVTRRPS